MWQVENRSPFPHWAGFQRDHQGRSLWSIVLKASFAIRPDQPLRHLVPQPPLLQAPLTEGERMVADRDISLPRPFCDVLLSGHAHPPKGARPDRGWTASLRIGDWRKALHVLPVRQWHRGRPRPAPQPDAPVPLDWTATWGGPEVAENPLGRGTLWQEGAALPRLVPEGQGESSRVPVSFAPVPHGWPQRSRLGGTYDQAWLRRRAPLLPADLDPRYWQAAPPDQWLDPEALFGAPVELTGVAPQPLRFALPRLGFEVATRFRGQWVQHPPRLQMLTIDSDAMRLSMVLQAALPIGAAQFDVKVERSFIALRELQGFTVAAPDMPAFDAAQG